MMHHLYSSLDYCLLWPREMQALLSIAAILAFDPVSELRLPCLVDKTSWNYYTKLQFLVVLPAVAAAMLSALSFGVNMAKAHRRYRASGLEGDAYAAAMRTAAGHGLQSCACIVCMVADFVYPVCSRTVMQIWRCRKLGDAGYFLEARSPPPQYFAELRCLH